MDDIWPDRRGRSRGAATVHSAGEGTAETGTFALKAACPGRDDN